MLDQCAGIEVADSLSIDFIDQALANLVGEGLFKRVSSS